MHIPLSYYLGVTKKWGGGLWLGTFVGNMCLTVIYAGIVYTRNWEEIAEKVHEQMKNDDELQQTEMGTCQDNQYIESD